MQNYTCYQCQEKKEGKPWVIYEDKPNVCLCGFLCNHKSQKVMTHYNKVLNKEDFDYLRPIIPTNNEYNFVPKSEFEQSLMTDEEFSKYQEEYNEYFAYRPEEHQVYLENVNNDEHTRSIEEFNGDEESDTQDDY